MTSISRISLAPFFPKDLQSSLFVSVGAGPSASGFASAGSTPFFRLVLALLPLVHLVPFMMTLFCFLFVMMARVWKALCSLP